MRYVVAAVYPDGHEVELARTRRLPGAVHELDGFVESARRAYKGHGDERVVVGPDLRPGEVAGESVVVLHDGRDWVYHVGIREVSEAPSGTRAGRRP